MKLSHTFFLRMAVIITMLAHSIPGMFNNGIHDFGNLYLNQVGFDPLGIYIAWMIKLSHIAYAIALLTQRWVKLFSIITLFILVIGIFMVHLPDGWFVVGGGRNGIEFNFLLIMAILTLLFPNGVHFKN